MDVGAGLDELGGEPERLRRRVRVLEAARVGDERDVERLRDLRASARRRARAKRSRSTSLVEEASPTTRLTSPKRVLSWWWSMLTVSGACSSERRVRADALLVRAVERDQHALGGVVRRLAPQAVERHEAVLLRQRRVAVEVHRAVLAERVEGELDREQRAERVAVGVLVGDEEEAVVRAERVRDRPQVTRRLSGASSSISWVMRTPRSTVGSYSKASWGVRFIRSSRARRACRTPCAAARPVERLRALRLGAEHADEDARVPQVGRGLDAGDRDEADARVLQLAEALGDHLAHGLVDPAHAVAHPRYSSGSPPTRGRARAS